MPRKPDERIVKAKEMYHDGMKLVEIASQLNLPEGTVRRWKSTHKWDSERSDKIKTNVRIKKRKRGGQPGNHNATGPPGNKHAEKHGFFSKWLPEETKEILDEISGNDPIDLLWDNIQLQYAAIIRAQKLMHVKDQQDKTIEKIEEKSGNVDGERWEVQQAWDKQANFMTAQSRAMKTLEGMISKYDELIHKNWDNVTDEQKERIALLKAQRSKLEQRDDEHNDQYEDDDFVKALNNTVEKDWEDGDDKPNEKSSTV